MFEVGFWEMVLVGIVALLVLSPERLPKVARETGFWLRKIRKTVHDAKAEIKRELELDELKKSMALPRIDPLSLLKESSIPQSEVAATQIMPEAAGKEGGHE